MAKAKIVYRKIADLIPYENNARTHSENQTKQIACEKTGRDCRMMELDPKYCDVIIERWQDFTGKQAIHAETGQAFNG